MLFLIEYRMFYFIRYEEIYKLDPQFEILDKYANGKRKIVLKF